MDSESKFEPSVAIYKINPGVLGRSPSNYNLFYRTPIWLPNIFTRQKFGFQISLHIINDVIEVDEHDQGNIYLLQQENKTPDVTLLNFLQGFHEEIDKDDHIKPLKPM